MWWVAESSHGPTPFDRVAANRSDRDPQPKAAEEQPQEPVWWRLATRTIEDPVALWTFCLVIFTGILAFVSFSQFKYLRRADQTARIAANAASKSAAVAERSLTDLERAYVFFTKVTDPGFKCSLDGKSVSMRTGLKYILTNHGRTPAILTEIVERHFISGKSKEFTLPLPIDPNAEGAQLIPNGIGIGAGQPYELTYPLFVIGDIDAYAGVGRDERDFFFMGYIRYVDIFGRKHRTGFCLIYNKFADDFFAVGGGEYNYIENEE
jgi:hypothetical protein